MARISHARQGENASASRIVGDTVRLEQVPAILQAMGYYPSSQEIDDLLNEVRYGRFVDGDTNPVIEVKFSEIIQRTN